MDDERRRMKKGDPCRVVEGRDVDWKRWDGEERSRSRREEKEEVEPGRRCENGAARVRAAPSASLAARQSPPAPAQPAAPGSSGCGLVITLAERC